LFIHKLIYPQTGREVKRHNIFRFTYQYSTFFLLLLNVKPNAILTYILHGAESFWII